MDKTNFGVTDAMYATAWRAKQWATEIGCKSPCTKSKRGVVIFSPPRDRRQGGEDIWGEGYNAPPEPFRCDGSEACRAACGRICVHAEQAALLDFWRGRRDAQARGDPRWPRLSDQWTRDEGEAQLEMLHVKVVNGEAVPGGPPSCVECSKLILASGLRAMWLYEVRPRDDLLGTPEFIASLDAEKLYPTLVRYTALEFHTETLRNLDMTCTT